MLWEGQRGHMAHDTTLIDFFNPHTGFWGLFQTPPRCQRLGFSLITQSFSQLFNICYLLLVMTVRDRPIFRSVLKIVTLFWGLYRPQRALMFSVLQYIVSKVLTTSKRKPILYSGKWWICTTQYRLNVSAWNYVASIYRSYNFPLLYSICLTWWLLSKFYFLRGKAFHHSGVPEFHFLCNVLQ